MGKKKSLATVAQRRVLLDLVKKKREADKGKEKPICVTRTVEMLPSKPAGDERTKLLFVLALGLVPNPKNGNTNGPVVTLDKLDPSAEVEARARRKKWIGNVFRRRRLQRIRARLAYYRYNKNKQSLSSSYLRRTSHRVPVHHIPSLSSLAANIEKEVNVETVDLVSSDDDCKALEDTSSLQAAGISSTQTSEPFDASNPGIQRKQQHVPKVSNACTKPANCKRKSLSSSLLQRYMKPVYGYGRIIGHVQALRGRPIPAILTHKRLVSNMTRASTSVVPPEIERDPLSSSSSCVSTVEYIIPDDPVITID